MNATPSLNRDGEGDKGGLGGLRMKFLSWARRRIRYLFCAYRRGWEWHNNRHHNVIIISLKLQDAYTVTPKTTSRSYERKRNAEQEGLGADTSMYAWEHAGKHRDREPRWFQRKKTSIARFITPTQRRSTARHFEEACKPARGGGEKHPCDTETMK
jgi:hypothetical protein